MERVLSPEEIRNYYKTRVPRLKLTETREWRGPCPIHSGQRDSFAVNNETGACFCHSKCKRGWSIFELETELTGVNGKAAYAEVMKIVGRPEPRREVKAYDYTDEHGRLLFQVVRYQPKDFKQRRPDGNGGWAWNLHAIEPVLYRLPRLLAHRDQAVVVVEGEEDVHTIEKLGMLATTGPMGARKWRPSYSEVLRGREVFILPDNDRDGREDVIQKATSLLRAECTVHIIELAGLGEKGDVSDWVAAGGTTAELEHLFQDSVAEDAGSLEELCSRWGIPSSPKKVRDEASPAETEPKPDSKPATDTDGTHTAQAADHWPTPAPLQGELPPVQEFDLALLPESFRPLVEDVTERMQVPVDVAAIAMVLCLAGAVNRRATIQPKALDSSWVEVPNLWGGIVAPPGFMKSPVLQACTRPLHRIQAKWHEEYAAAMEEYAREKEKHEHRRKAWGRAFQEAAKRGKPEPPQPEETLAEPALRRLITNDSTFESLHQTMSRNPAGILMIRDELTGWLSRLDREEFGHERAFALTAWNGNQPYTVDRIQRGLVYAPACCLSVLGTITPGRLRSYLADALADGPSNDGLMQRFQLLVWPDTSPEWKYVDQPPASAAADRVAATFARLVEMNPEEPARFRFSGGAQELFVEWLTELESKVRGNELHPALASHLSKYKKLMPALALLFELADGAAEDIVSLQHGKQAAG
jgi:putative DNA primase/helicase